MNVPTALSDGILPQNTGRWKLVRIGQKWRKNLCNVSLDPLIYQGGCSRTGSVYSALYINLCWRLNLEPSVLKLSLKLRSVAFRMGKGCLPV